MQYFALQIVATGAFFVMNDDAGLPTDLQSSMFNKSDEYLGSKTYTGSLPLTPNKRNINNSHYINTSNAGREIDVLIWLAGRPWKQALMKFTVESVMISYTLYIDGGVVVYNSKSMKLSRQDPDFDGQMSFDTYADFYNYMDASVTGDPQNTPVVFFPIKNEAAYKDIPAEEQGSYSDIAFPINNYMNAWKIDTNTGTGAFARDPNGGPYKQTILPLFKLVYVVKRVMRMLGYEIAGDWIYDENANKIVIYSNVSTAKFALPDYSYFMPDITITDFIKELRTRFGLLISFNLTSKIVTISALKSILSSKKVIDLRPYQLAGTYRETGDAPGGYTITQPADGGDKAFANTGSDGLPSITIGDMSGRVTIDEINLSSVVTKMYSGLGPQVASWRVPEILMPVYPTTPFDQVSEIKDPAKKNDFKLRLLYYHGMVNNSAGYAYPYGSADNLHRLGNKLTDFSLEISNTGVIYSGLKDYHDYIRNSKPFECAFKLPLDLIFDLDPDCKILCYDFDFSTVISLYDVISTNLQNKKIATSLVTLYPQIIPDNEIEAPTSPDTPPIDPPPPPVDNGEVWVKLVLENYTRVESSYPPPFYNRDNADVTLYFYADAAGTIAKDVTNLTVRVRTIASTGGSSQSDYTNEYVCTSHDGKLVVEPGAAVHTNAGGTSSSWSYSLRDGAAYHML